MDSKPEQPKPDGGGTDHRPMRPRVKIVGDPARSAEHFRNVALAPSIAMQEQIRGSLAGLGPQSAITDAREAVMKVFGDLRQTELPKIDWSAMVEST